MTRSSFSLHKYQEYIAWQDGLTRRTACVVSAVPSPVFRPLHCVYLSCCLLLHIQKAHLSCHTQAALYPLANIVSFAGRRASRCSCLTIYSSCSWPCSRRRSPSP